MTTKSIVETETEPTIKLLDQKQPHKVDIIWKNVLMFIVLHYFAFRGLFLISQVCKSTFIFGYIYGLASGLGITAGVHRLWAHRSYKARLPLQLFLAICNCIAMENSIHDWARDHRTHHKFSETDADPHNANRGFFFAHMGWLMCRKHPQVLEKGKIVDFSDLTNDPVVMFQHKYYIPLAMTFGLLIPTLVPVIFFQEDLLTTLFTCFAFRLVVSLHCTWLVNSAAHLYGNRPYNKLIGPRENRFVAFFAMGEGFHNYHHSFPWDYSTSEWGIKLNPTTGFINLMAFFGLAYDLKKASPELVTQCQLRNERLLGKTL